MWNSKTMEMVSILQGGHDRGIATVAFSSDGEVSTTCMIAMCIPFSGVYKNICILNAQKIFKNK